MAMIRHDNMTDTKGLMGLLPLYVGMHVRLTERILAPTERDPWGVPANCLATVVEIIPHPSEGNILSRASASRDGFVVLHRLPRAVLIKVERSDGVFLPPDANGMMRPGVVAVTPVKRPWIFKDGEAEMAQVFTHVDRYQLPLAPFLVRTLHTMQGVIAEAGIVAHWNLPEYWSEAEKWLATYVMLSRPRSLKMLLSHGLPCRELLERGPPDAWQTELEEVLEHVFECTKVASSQARMKLNWPARGVV